MAERDDKEGEGAPTGAVFRRGVAWVLAGNVGDRVLGFLFGIVLARLLAPEIFGHFLTLQVFTGLAGFIAGGGMGQALVRAKVAEKPDFDIVFTLQLVLGVVIYAVFFFAAPLFEAANSPGSSGRWAMTRPSIAPARAPGRSLRASSTPMTAAAIWPEPRKRRSQPGWKGSGATRPRSGI